MFSTILYQTQKVLSDEGKDAITQLHVDGILSYVRACE